VHDWREDIEARSISPCCGFIGRLRPHVVWFGEMPLAVDSIYAALAACDLFISIGTSGTVYPAAGFVQEARAAGADTVELNLERSEAHSLFAEGHYGPATEIVPAFVAQLLGGA
jgi:NAD-dependent deacetylase